MNADCERGWPPELAVRFGRVWMLAVARTDRRIASALGGAVPRVSGVSAIELEFAETGKHEAVSGCTGGSLLRAIVRACR